MPFLAKLRQLIFGKARDPLSTKTRHSLVLVAFLAWVGLGADGLSSSCYGPEEAFKALGEHRHLSLYLAIVTAATVFIIALAYNQVIELFPTGGGGYRVATKLVGPHAGLVSGAALILDYILTIAISVASGVDALFSLFPPAFLKFKLITEVGFIALLIILNLRGMKESITVLLPVFLGFFISHVFLILYGIIAHGDRIPQMVANTWQETHTLSSELGWTFTLALFLRAYSLGGGTYTGIEAVSNNVQSLAEPRVKTGKLTMLYMALSLAFVAGGIILLYLLWDSRPVEGKTLNAVTFGAILQNLNPNNPMMANTLLWLVLLFEAGLLFVAANTGFLGGPAVLSNMAIDSWVPHQFRYLSTRLVTQNGILFMGVAALGILVWTRGHVELLVVLYSINVFLTFSLSLLGLCIYWWHERNKQEHWRRRLLLSLLGLLVTSSILTITIVEKFAEGAWVTVLTTGLVVIVGLVIHKHYADTKKRIREIDALFANQPYGSVVNPPKLDPKEATAVFVVGSSRGGGLHALLWVQRMFPNHFKNFIFINARTVDSQSYGGSDTLELLKQEANVALSYFVNFCHSHGLAAKSYLAFGTDAVEEVAKLSEKVSEDFPNSIFFTSKLIFQHDNWLTRLLHNQAALALQRRLHLQGMQMVILPMKL